jgi:uncharacterized membrane protein YuzA (DUF378 family)
MVLVIIGALNWGLIGFFDYNLLGDIFFRWGGEKTVYALIGLAGLFAAYRFISKCCNPACKCCGKANCKSMKK